MKKYLTDTWEDFNNQSKGKEIYLFGYNGAISLLKQLEKYDSRWDIKGIIDNDKDKQSLKVAYLHQTIPVISPYSLKEKLNDEICVLICGTYTHEMGRQLELMGIQNYYSEIWMSRPSELKNITPQMIDENRYQAVRKLLNDEKSKMILDSIIEKRKRGEIDYSDIMERGESEYFIDEFWQPFSNGVFIDGGGYNGDSIEEIVKWTKGDFKRIYTFEPQKDLAKIIHNEVAIKYNNRVVLLNSGLWSYSGELKFRNGTNVLSGTIMDGGGETISVVSLDEVIEESVSFIKMDIEGAEVEALKGAKRIIQENKPKMAICIYHKPDDMWAIPLLIHEFVPNYRFYMRHCGISCYGTILYAVP